MVHALEQRGAALRNRLIRAAGSYVFHQPEQLVRQYRQRIDRHRTGMVHAAAHTVQSYQQRIDELSLKLSHCLHLQLQQKQQRLNHAGAQLRVLSPYAVLERGYSITRLADGTVVRDATRVQQGDQLTTTLRHGSIHSVAKRITTQEE
jgi:exodeoxyribonuclease VII large subunit